MAARKQLRYAVSVVDKDGNNVQFVPGDEVPAWASKLITNKKAWDSDDEDEAVAHPGPSETVQAVADAAPEPDPADGKHAAGK